MIDTAPSLALVVTIALLTTVGVYLLLERSLTRVLLGVIVLGNAINLGFLVAGGRAGGAPITGRTPEGAMSDPLPQAMVLTAIVITLGMTAFLLAMAYRSWQLNAHDEVQDDLEDRRIARRAAADEAAYLDLDSEVTTTLDEDAAGIRDETVDAREARRAGGPVRDLAEERDGARDGARTGGAADGTPANGRSPRSAEGGDVR